jgi:hypothetical protein
MDWDKDTGFSEEIDPKGFYVFVSDFAASKDESAHSCIRFNINIPGPDNFLIETPYRLVFHKAFVGDTVPISMQYEMVRAWVNAYKSKGARCEFVYDGQSLGGKNVGEALADLKGRPFPPQGVSAVAAKNEALGVTNEVVSRGRKVKYFREGSRMDSVENWGFLKISSKITALKRQFEFYKLDDRKLTQDRLMTIIMGLHYIEKRAAKSLHRGAVNFNIGRTIGSFSDNYGRRK